MKWLVTGGCGFIGTALIKALLRQGVEDIRVLDNLSVGTKTDLGKVASFREIDKCYSPPRGVELLVADIRDEFAAIQASQGCDIIVHLAANTGVGPSVDDPRSDCLSNVIGTFNFLDAARRLGIKRFVFASSGAPAGEVEPPIHEEIPPHPASPYGASKLAGEAYCSAFAKCYGIDAVALRFGNVYGPGSAHKGSVVAKFIKRAQQGLPLEIFGDGGQTRDFIFIEDLVSAILLAASVSGIGGEVFQIATSRETTVSELVDKLRVAMKGAGISEVEVRNSDVRVGDVRRNFADTRKAKRVLGWQARTDLDIGLRKTVAYFISEGEN